MRQIPHAREREQQYRVQTFPVHPANISQLPGAFFPHEKKRNSIWSSSAGSVVVCLARGSLRSALPAQFESELHLPWIKRGRWLARLGEESIYCLHIEFVDEVQNVHTAGQMHALADFDAAA